jgi:twinkle protein
MPQDQLYDVMSKVHRAFYFIQPDKDDDMMTVSAILTRAKALVYRNGIKALLIDPWNEIEHSIPQGQREDQYISIQLAKIRRFARVHAVHVFLIAHPRQLEKDKSGKYPPPTAYDISGGSMWRNKADNILCVFRPDIKESDTDVYVQKIRFRRNGKVGETMKFRFHVGTSTYYAVQEN